MIILSRAAAFLLFFLWVGTAAAEKIDINTAPLEDLVKIVHIGEIRAKELISLRPFFSLDGLVKIKGIGEARLRDIKEQGLAWVGLQSPTPSEEPVDIGYQSLVYPTAVIINEILASPEGPDEKEEWIEIFNQNNFEVNLSYWQITDTVGKITVYTFPSETKIAAQGFLVLSRPETEIALNNDGDKVMLFDPDAKVLDEVSYQNAPLGQSYSLTDSGWVWNNSLTPGSANVVPLPTPAKAKEKDEEMKDEPQKELAAISQPFQRVQDKQIPKTFSTLFIAFGLAMLSSIIILFLKRKIKLPGQARGID